MYWLFHAYSPDIRQCDAFALCGTTELEGKIRKWFAIYSLKTAAIQSEPVCRGASDERVGGCEEEVGAGKESEGNNISNDENPEDWLTL